MMNRARILLADDHVLFRDGLASLINSQPDMEVVGRAEDGLEAFALAHELKPDLVIMDINMPISDGLEAARLIRNELPEVAILILTVSDKDTKLFEAIKAGAVGYMLKNLSSDDFVRGVRSVLTGETVLPRELAKRLLEEFATLASQPKPCDDEEASPVLTTREHEVLELIVAGATNKEISEQLAISLYTTKSHVRNILSKLHASSRGQAAQIALKQRWVRGNQRDQTAS